MYNGVKKTCEKEFSCRPADKEWNWVDIKVDRASKTVAALWRLNLTDKSNNSTGQDLVSLTLQGIKKHFSRDITRYSSINEVYTVSSTAINNIKPMMYRNFSLENDTEGNKVSSSGPFATIYYDSTRDIKENSKNEFLYNSAHECGHIVLNMAYEDDINSLDVSWRHKGTSTGIKFTGQDALDDSPSGIFEIYDLMWYYKGDLIWNRAIAGNEDVRGLIYLSQIIFGNIKK